MSVADSASLRRLALALPEASEQDHHGRPSFRVANKIFATIWDPDHANLMLDQGGILTAVQRHPKACAEFWWGERLRAAQIKLSAVREEQLAELLADAWEHKAPRRLLSQIRLSSPSDLG